MTQWTLAEEYPTIRWNFAWRHYVLVGIPDGISDEFVYEFKATGSRFLSRFAKPVGLAQADLYGHFFDRPQKRVQMFIKEDGKTETFDGPVDHRNAEITLDSFARVDQGEPARPPAKWKCRPCEFRTVCPICQEPP
jgi:hypothetical protein